MNIEVNFIAILFAGVAAMLVGFLWYSPLFFAKAWMQAMGHTDKSMKEMQKNNGKLYGISFIQALFTAFVLSHVMALSEAFYAYPSLLIGLTTAFWLWLGLIMPVQSTDVIFGGKPWKLFYINTGYQLVSVLAMGIVLGLF